MQLSKNSDIESIAHRKTGVILPRMPAQGHFSEIQDHDAPENTAPTKNLFID